MTRSASKPAVEVAVELEKWDRLDFDAAAHAMAVIPVAMKAGKPRGSVSVLLTGDKAIRVLNRDFRGKDKATNVLSFPMEEKGFLGDIAVAFETTKREAKAMDVSFRDHFTHVLVHGTLHLEGHDHIDDDEAERMEKREISILKGFGIENPYARPRFLA